MHSDAISTSVRSRKPIYRHLYFQVLTAIALGVALGHFYPDLGAAMKPLGDIFIKAVKMIISPVIFCTVVHGIASAGDLKRVGKIGLKALIYFEVLTTIALLIGLVSMNVVQPGVGMNVDPATLDPKGVASVTASSATSMSAVDYFMHIVPNTFLSAFSEGEILQVLFVSLLFAVALNMLGSRAKPLVDMIDMTANVLFGIVEYNESSAGRCIWCNGVYCRKVRIGIARSYAQDDRRLLHNVHFLCGSGSGHYCLAGWFQHLQVHQLH